MCPHGSRFGGSEKKGNRQTGQSVFPLPATEEIVEVAVEEEEAEAATEPEDATESPSDRSRDGPRSLSSVAEMTTSSFGDDATMLFDAVSNGGF